MMPNIDIRLNIVPPTATAQQKRLFVREVYRHGYFIVRYSGMIDKSLSAYQLIPMGEDANKRVIEVEKIANEDEALRQYECIVLELMRGLV